MPPQPSPTASSSRRRLHRRAGGRRAHGRHGPRRARHLIAGEQPEGRGVDVRVVAVEPASDLFVAFGGVGREVPPFRARRFQGSGPGEPGTERLYVFANRELARPPLATSASSRSASSAARTREPERASASSDEISRVEVRRIEPDRFHRLVVSDEHVTTGERLALASHVLRCCARHPQVLSCGMSPPT